MFSKISRYRDLPDEVAIDPRGRAVASKVLRPMAVAGGTFRHVVEDVDRLDHLAFKYYDQSRDWWRIADANPEFPWPPALVSEDHRRTLVVPIVWEGPQPPWADLVSGLRRTRGVETALLGSPEHDGATREVVDGSAVGDLARALAVDLDAAVRTQAIGPPLAAALSAIGVTIAGAVRPAKIDAATWRISALAARRLYTFRDFPADDLLRVCESEYRFSWIVVITYNSLTVSEAHLQHQIENLAFVPGSAAAVRRAGKTIVIPPRAA